MFQSKDINIWRLYFVFCLTSIYRHAIPVYGSQTLLTSIYGACLAIYGSQTSKHSPTGRKWIRSSNVNIFCLEHFYTIRYNTFLHTFLCSTTYQKLVFYAGIPLKDWWRLTIKRFYRWFDPVCQTLSNFGKIIYYILSLLNFYNYSCNLMTSHLCLSPFSIYFRLQALMLTKKSRR